MHQMVPQFRVLAKVDAPNDPAYYFISGRMLGFKLIDTDEGVETHKRFCISVLPRIKFSYVRRQIH